MEHKIAHTAGGAVGRSLSLSCQNAYRSVFRFLHPQLRLQRGVRRRSSWPVRADRLSEPYSHPTLTAGLQPRAGKITFGDAVFLVQERQRIQLDALSALCPLRQRADHDIQLLAPQTRPPACVYSALRPGEGSRSVTQNTGSPASSPRRTSTLVRPLHRAV